MCGISGIFGREDHATVQSMLSTIQHRGPDELHAIVTRGATLGATRLSIIDQQGGRQPMSNEDQTVWAAQNGEIYNFLELRQQLSASGHRLATRCDTEVLAHLYEDYGQDLVQHIDGMFAVSVWDANRQTGLLARDRAGKKPLYYHVRNGALYYASELKAILAIAGFDRRLNLEALHHYLAYKHIPHPLSAFEDIYMLPPGSMLTFRPGFSPRISRYWDLNFAEASEDFFLDEEQIQSRLIELLETAVKRRLVADVPIGFFLSGGVDSALSTALAARASGQRIKTFTLTYSGNSTTDGKEQDTYWARWVARKYNTDHHEEQVDLGSFPEELPQILRAFDEPFSGVVSTYFLSRLISRHVKVAISGDGADELFGSYLSHRIALPLQRFSEYLQTDDHRHLEPCENQAELLAQLHGMPDWQWRSRLLVFREEEKLALYSPEMRSAMGRLNTETHLRDTFERVATTDPLNRILDMEFRSFFPDQVLAFTDRLSMAHSLEVRTPYLDTEFMQFAASLPSSYRIRGNHTKYILKKAATRYLPAEMIYRPKEGFVLPINGWLLTDLEHYVRDTLSPAALRETGVFCPDAVERLISRFYAGATRHANQLLSLLCFQEWFNLYRPSIGSPERAAA